jgi:hypothetical protein
VPTAPREVAARWTPKLAGAGWTPISDVFLDSYTKLDPPITNVEALLIIHLMKFKWDASPPYPGFKTLARRMAMTSTSVRNHARSLQKKGYLIRLKRVGTTNRFDLNPLFNALEDLLAKRPVIAKAVREEAPSSADPEPAPPGGWQPPPPRPAQTVGRPRKQPTARRRG